MEGYNMKAIITIGLLLCSFTIGAQQVKWYTFEEAVELNKKEPRKILVDVYTDWCGYCKLMDKNTFANGEVAEYMNSSYYPVKFDAEQREDVLFNNHTFKFIPQGNKGVHELAYTLLQGKMSYPSTVFLNEDVAVIYIQKGYVLPDDFNKILEYFGTDQHLKESEGQ